MKKLISIIICFCLVFGVFSCIPQSAFAQTQESGIYTYTVKNGEATIVNVDEFARGDITIPSELGGYPVTKIGSYAFSLSLFTSIVVPNSVTTIGDDAFRYCPNLESITVEPTTPPSLGQDVFDEISPNATFIFSNPSAYKNADGWKDLIK